MPWQPIDTAPKDGTEFLVFKESIGVVGPVKYLEQDHADHQGDFPHVSWDHQPLEDATHWHELPPAPDS
jgi:hypothetical protein